MPTNVLIGLHSGDPGSCIKYVKLKPAEVCSKHYIGSFGITMWVQKMFCIDFCGGLKRNDLREIIYLNS